MTDDSMRCWIHVCMYKRVSRSHSFGSGQLFEKAVTCHFTFRDKLRLSESLLPLSTEATTRSLEGFEVTRKFLHAFRAAGARSDRSDEEASFRVHLTVLRSVSNQTSSRRAEQQTHQGAAGWRQARQTAAVLARLSLNGSEWPGQGGGWQGGGCDKWSK